MSTLIKGKGASGLTFMLIIALVLSSVVNFGINDVNAASYGQVGQYTKHTNIADDETLVSTGAIISNPVQDIKLGSNTYGKFSKSIAGTDVDNQFEITLNAETDELINRTSVGSNLFVVIDISISMDNSSYKGKTRWNHFRESLMTLVTDFLRQNPDNKVGISIFGGSVSPGPSLVHKNICEWTDDIDTATESFNKTSAEEMCYTYFPGNNVGDIAGSTNGQAAFRAALEGIQSKHADGTSMSSTMPEQPTSMVVVTDGDFTTSYSTTSTPNNNAINESAKITEYVKTITHEYPAELYTFGIDTASNPINSLYNTNINKTFLASNSTIDAILKALYQEIYKETKSYVKPELFTDPMSKWVKYEKLISGNESAVNFQNGTLTWDMENDKTFTTTQIKNGSGEVIGTKKNYTMTYLVTLDTDTVDQFSKWETFLPTNKNTTLDYKYDNGSGTEYSGQASSLIPTVNSGEEPIKVGDINITKTVSNNAPAGETFDFTVYVGSDTTGDKYSGEYSIDGVSKGNMTAGKLQLKGGEIATLKNITLGTKITVKESAKPFYQVEGTDTKTGEVSLKTNTIAFANQYVKSDDLSAVKTSNPANGTTVKNGDNIKYTITVTNDDTVTATGVVARDYIPAHTTFAGVENDGIYDNTAGKVDWYVGDLGAGKSSSVSFTVKVAEETGDDIVNVGLFKQTGEFTKDKALTNKDSYSQTAEIAHKAPEPAMELVKTNTPGSITTVRAGEEIEYKIKVNNTGYRTLKNVWVKDYIPEGTTYKVSSVSTSYSGIYSSANSYVQWLIPEIKVGGNAEVSFKVTVNQTYPATGLIKNTALGEILGEVGTPGATDPTVKSNVTTNPTSTVGDIKISKAVSSNAPYDDTFSFIVYEGNDTTGNKYTGKYSIGGVSKGNMTNGQLTLKGGETAMLIDVPLGTKITVKESSKPYYTVEGSDTKTGEVSSLTSTIAFKNNYEKSNILEAVKTSNPANGTVVKNGDNITYTITVSNYDVETASGVVVKDMIPDHTSFVSAENGGVYNSTSSAVSWFVGNIGPGKNAKVSFTVKVKEETGDDIVNVGLYKQTGETTSSAAFADKGAFSETGQVTHKAPEPKMELVKTSAPGNGTNVNAGEAIEYKIKVNNTGYRTLKNVWVKDYIPEQTTYRAGSVSTAHGGKYEASGDYVEWLIPEVKVGGSVELTFTVTVNTYPTLNTIKNTALGEILGEGGTPGAVDPTDKSNAVTNPTPTVGDVNISKTVSSNAPSDDEFDFIVYVGKDTTGARYEGQYSINEAVKGNMTNGRLTLKGGQVAKLIDIALGTNITVKEVPKAFYKVQGSDTKTGKVVLATETIAFKNNYEKSEKLNAEKTSDPKSGDVAKIGDNIKYTITVTNDDVTTAMGVVIRDTVPKYTEFVNVENDGIYDGSDTISWYIGDLGPGEDARVSFTVKVNEEADEDIVNIGQYKQTGEATSGGALANEDPFSETTEVVHVPASPSMDITKSTDSNKSVGGGESVEYKITVNNTGFRTLKNVWLKDYIPTYTTYKADSVSADNGGRYDEAGKYVEWVIPEVAIGDSVTVSFTATVDDTYPNAAVIKNTALGEILGEGGEPRETDPADKSNEVTTETVEVIPEAAKPAEPAEPEVKGEDNTPEEKEQVVLGEDAQTSDEMNSLSYLLIIIIAAAGLFILAMRRRMKNN